MANETNGLLRPHYFERQQLRAADLMVAQDYLRERLRRHNRFLHGWGVVCGAQVAQAPSDSLWTLSVSQGYAVTPHGDEIYIPADVSFNIEPGVEACLGLPPPCPDPEDLSEVAEDAGPVQVIRANIDPAGKDVGGNYNEEWVDLLVLEETNLNGYTLRHITNPGTPDEGRETYYTFSESESFDAGTVVRVHSGAERLHAEPAPEIIHRYRASSSEVGNWRLNNIGDTIYVLNAQGVQVASASFLPGSLVPIGEGIVYLTACPADEPRCPQPAIPANCQPGGGVYQYSRICETVQFKIACDLPPSHQHEVPSCEELEEIVCGSAHVPCPPAAVVDDNCVVLARITVGGDSVLQIDDLSDRRQLFSESLLQAYLRCRCEPVEVECVDFEELPLEATLNVGDSFIDSGVTVTGQTFFWSNGQSTDGGFARIEDGGLAGGSGQEVQVNNINLAFDFGTALPGLTLRFGEFGGNLNLAVNGDFRNFENFDQIDGDNIGGAEVSVTGGTGQAQGVLTLQGEISSFAIGGQELWIDDVCPSTITVLPERAINNVIPPIIQGNLFSATEHLVTIFGEGLADATAVTFANSADAILNVFIVGRFNNRLDLQILLRQNPVEGERPFTITFPDGQSLFSGEVQLDIRVDFIFGMAGETFTVELDETSFNLAQGLGEPIDAISGIGGVRGSRLREAGADNVLALATLPPEKTAEIAEVSVEMATLWRDEALELMRR